MLNVMKFGGKTIAQTEKYTGDNVSNSSKDCFGGSVLASVDDGIHNQEVAGVLLRLRDGLPPELHDVQHRLPALGGHAVHLPGHYLHGIVFIQLDDHISVGEEGTVDVELEFTLGEPLRSELVLALDHLFPHVGRDLQQLEVEAEVALGHALPTALDVSATAVDLMSLQPAVHDIHGGAVLGEGDSPLVRLPVLRVLADELNCAGPDLGRHESFGIEEKRVAVLPLLVQLEGVGLLGSASALHNGETSIGILCDLHFNRVHERLEFLFGLAWSKNFENLKHSSLRFELVVACDLGRNFLEFLFVGAGLALDRSVDSASVAVIADLTDEHHASHLRSVEPGVLILLGNGDKGLDRTGDLRPLARLDGLGAVPLRDEGEGGAPGETPVPILEHVPGHLVLRVQHPFQHLLRHSDWSNAGLPALPAFQHVNSIELAHRALQVP